MDIPNFDCSSSHCVMCDSPKLRKFRALASDATSPAMINVVECDDCKFAWQYPRGRSVAESKDYFVDAYSHSSNKNSDYFAPEQRIATAVLQVNYLKSLGIGATSKILDIGAGAGFFARQGAKEGWDISVFDPAIDGSVSFPDCISVIGESTSNIHDNSYDVITLWDVIEHVESPTDLLLEVFRLLKKGGILIIETGNYMSAERASYGRNHWIYQLDHRWYFSPESIEKLLISTGFNEIDCYSKVLRPSWVGDKNYSGPSRRMLIRDLVKTPKGAVETVRRFVELTLAKRWTNAGLNIFTIKATRK